MVHCEFLWLMWSKNWRFWIGRLCIQLFSKNVLPERHSSESSMKPIHAKSTSWLFQVLKGNLHTNGSNLWWTKRMDTLIVCSQSRHIDASICFLHQRFDPLMPSLPLRTWKYQLMDLACISFIVDSDEWHSVNTFFDKSRIHNRPIRNLQFLDHICQRNSQCTIQGI